MKIDWNTKYNTISVYACIVIISILAFYLSLSQFSDFTEKISNIVAVLQPFIIGFFIAFILNFILKFYENYMFKIIHIEKLNLKAKGTRGISILLTYITAAVIVYLFIKFVLPQLVDSIVGLVNDIPTYIDQTTIFFNDFMKNLNIDNQYLQIINENFNEMINYVIGILKDLLPVLAGALTSIASSVWNIVLGLIISIYMLLDKEKFSALSKKMIYAFFSKSIADNILKISNLSNSTFEKFLIGKIIDSTIIGILTFVLLRIFNIPYALLVSIIVGITNIIPFFGPFIGAVPSFVIILFVSPVKSLWFLVLILIIQQLDGNIIGPKVLGNSIGISPFWILFSILITGKLLGIVGMIIGVPLFAIIYSILKEVVENRLKKKKLHYKTEDYM